MTRAANDGRDKPFSDWLRKHRELDSNQIGLDVSDIDFVFHKFRTHIDGIGERRIKLMMDAEIKTWGKNLSKAQNETLFFRHQLLNSRHQLFSSILNKKVVVWHFGQFVLKIIGGDRPDRCSGLHWGIFDQHGLLTYKDIMENQLIEILGFQIYPNNFEKITMRRHHKTTDIWTVKTRGYLFPFYKRVVKRS